jgi:hypothetical protein
MGSRRSLGRRATLIVAAVYEVTPLKNVCLGNAAACSAPGMTAAILLVLGALLIAAPDRIPRFRGAAR